MIINVCILRVRKGKKKKDFNFDTVSAAARFEERFRKCGKEGKNIETELISEQMQKSAKLMQELSRIPEKYAEAEYIKWFGTQE